MADDGVSKSLVLHPQTGELLDLKSEETDVLLDRRDEVNDAERALREYRREVEHELIERMDHEGRRSFTFTEFKIDVSPPTEKQWDVPALQQTLANLVGRELISLAKAERCMRVKYEPVWRELKTLLSDPRVGDHIRACFEEVPARRYVKVTRR